MENLIKKQKDFLEEVKKTQDEILKIRTDRKKIIRTAYQQIDDELKKIAENTGSYARIPIMFGEKHAILEFNSPYYGLYNEVGMKKLPWFIKYDGGYRSENFNKHITRCNFVDGEMQFPYPLESGEILEDIEILVWQWKDIKLQIENFFEIQIKEAKEHLEQLKRQESEEVTQLLKLFDLHPEENEKERKKMGRL